MTSKRVWLCLVVSLVLLAVQQTSAERGNPMVQFEGQAIDDMIGAFMKEHGIPGMTLAIVQAPYISRVVGYGTSDVERGLLASPKTLWSIGQMTQAYTAVAIMQLVEAGKMALDDRVGKHVADLPSDWQSITVRQLMGHISGLPDYTKQPSFQPFQAYEPGELIALVKDVPLAFKAGTQVAASATDFFLLGLVIEKVSGMSYEAFVTKNQIERLGLKNTLFVAGLPNVKQEAVEKNDFKHKDFLSERAYIDPTEAATGYMEQDGRIPPVKQISQSAWRANAGLLASAEDISLWDIGLAGSILVSKQEHRDFLYNGFKLNDGTPVPANCGWRFPGHKGLMDIKGNVPGFSCYLSRFTDKADLLCVTLCANREGIDLTGLARRIAGAFDRKLGPPAGPNVMTFRESCYPVAVTVDRLQAILRSKGVNIVGRVDHAGAAKEHNLELRPTELLIFGDPAVGTRLMQSRQSIALDLPLRVVVFQDASGSVWVGYNDPSDLASRHGISDQDRVVELMRKGLAAIVMQATVPY
jgi:D-alanyl-D-alanine carboxypeptidase